MKHQIKFCGWAPLRGAFCVAVQIAAAPSPLTSGMRMNLLIRFVQSMLVMYKGTTVQTLS